MMKDQQRIENCINICPGSQYVPTDLADTSNYKIPSASYQRSHFSNKKKRRERCGRICMTRPDARALHQSKKIIFAHFEPLTRTTRGWNGSTWNYLLDESAARHLTRISVDLLHSDLTLSHLTVDTQPKQNLGR